MLISTLMRPCYAPTLAPLPPLPGMFGATMGTLTTFGGEKAVFAREYGSGMYSLASYFWSRWLMQLPFTLVLPLLFATITYFMCGGRCGALVLGEDGAVLRGGGGVS